MRKPERLRPGDKVAIVSLSSGILGEAQFLHKYHMAKERLEQDYGLEVVVMPNALKGTEYLYRHPEARASDLMEAFRDQTIKAVFCAIGGDDTIRLLPHIDFEVLRQNPKIFTGFSDTTTNHMMMRKAGLVSYYGLSVMCNIAEYATINEYTRAAMEKTLFDPQPTLDILPSEFCSYESDKIWWEEANKNTPHPPLPQSRLRGFTGQRDCHRRAARRLHRRVPGADGHAALAQGRGMGGQAPADRDQRIQHGPGASGLVPAGHGGTGYL